MILSQPRYLLRRVWKKASRIGSAAVRELPWVRRRLERDLGRFVREVGVPAAAPFVFDRFRDRCLAYVESLSTDGIRYRYSASMHAPTIYGSLYAILLYSLLDRREALAPRRVDAWFEYFDSHQDPATGLFVDPALRVPHFTNGDAWGDRHFAAHVVIAYTAFNRRPRHAFRFLEEYLTTTEIRRWLDRLRSRRKFVDASNEIMNICVLLQYQRDAFSDSRCGDAVNEILQYMADAIDPVSGLWWRGPFDSPRALSAAVQGAYHIVPLFVYEGRTVPCAERMVAGVLGTQNRLGGFGVELNATGCEDIDSIYLLGAVGLETSWREQCKESLEKALPWVLSHVNPDGGLAWVRGRPFEYGHPLLASKTHESSLFGTWFRSLSLAFITRFLGIPNGFHLNNCPGYEVVRGRGA